MTNTGIVSNKVATAGGRTAWVETTTDGRYTVVCDGCRTDGDHLIGLAPALARLNEHAEQCTATR